MFWNETLECISGGDLETLQVTALKDQISRARRSPFYQERLDDAGLTETDVNTPEDIRRFPFTTKEDLRGSFPYGMLAVPLEDVVRVHVSSGTTGTPTAVYHTWNDVQLWADSMARCLYMAGMRKQDVFQNMTGYGLFTGGLGLHYGAEKLGSMVIPAGTGNSKRQITLMRHFGTTVLHIIPSYALKLLQTFEEMGVDPREDTSLRIAVIGAEPHSEETRLRIEEAYGVFAVNSYGLSEMNGPGVAFECPHKSGLHLWEDRWLVEIVDPVTLKPCREGEVGEVVMTTLNREAMPLLRYRTRDLAALIPGTCACGRGHRRLSRILGENG
jgi:phenylacetate-CoA ligase